MVLLLPPTCSFGIPAELRSWTSATNFQGSLSSPSPWFLWSEDYDTIDRLPLLLQLLGSLLYSNTLFFSSVSNIYCPSTLPLNVGHLRNSLIMHYRHTCSPNAMASGTFHNPATFLLFFSPSTLCEPRGWAKLRACQCTRNTRLQTTCEKHITKVLKRELL